MHFFRRFTGSFLLMLCCSLASWGVQAQTQDFTAACGGTDFPTPYNEAQFETCFDWCSVPQGVVTGTTLSTEIQSKCAWVRGEYANIVREVTQLDSLLARWQDELTVIKGYTSGEVNTVARAQLRQQREQYKNRFSQLDTTTNQRLDVETGEAFEPLFLEIDIEDATTYWYETIRLSNTRKEATCTELTTMDADAERATWSVGYLWRLLSNQKDAAGQDASWTTLNRTDYETIRRATYATTAEIRVLADQFQSECSRAKPPAVSNGGGILPGPSTQDLQGNPTGEDGVNYVTQRLLPGLINTLLFVTLSLGVIAIIVSGLQFLLSGLDASQQESAKQTVLYALVGMAVALLSFGIVRFIININLLG